MKTRRYATIAIIITMLLILPFILITDTAVASAATSPSFKKTKVELVGKGSTYQMEIKDKIDKSTYKWSSSNTSVAKVSNKGLITAVNKGTAKIKCEITYPSGKSKKTKTLTCNVTVTIPATSVRINNASLVNGAHVLKVGESYTFTSEVKPDNTSDKVYWEIAGGDTACVRIDDAANGKVTAVKAGKAILVASAAASATKDAADLSKVKDAIIIEAVEPDKPTATVKNVKVEDSSHISVEFDSAVKSDTVVTGNGELTSNIEIALGKNANKSVADDPGKLKGSLSSDGKILTITSEKALNGSYIISFSNQIVTTSGLNLEEAFKKFTYTDLTPPSILYTSVNDTGLVATINFSEPVNFTRMTISEVSVVTTTGESTSSSTLNILKNPMNYMASEDRKSLSIDLSNIAFTDRNKTFKVVMSGITDLAGNVPLKRYVEAYIKTDTSYKSQARLLSLLRTGYNTITATFDRAIDPLYPGYIQIDGGASIQGKVDSKDNKKVNYTISDTEANYTGARKVTIGYWNSYNVNPNDTSAERNYEMTVNFIADKTAPVLLTCEYDSDNSALTLTYNENVTITAASGTLASTYTGSNEDIKLINIGYTEMAHSEGNNIIKLKVTNLTLAGTYSITIPQGFVTDSFRNLSTAAYRDIAITSSNNSARSGSELPAPYYIAQNSDDLNKITIKFADKLDSASAKSVDNYKINGLIVSSAKLIENTPETGATVVLTIAENSIPYNLEYKLVISGVKGFNNSYSPISSYEYPLLLKENKRPAYVPQPVFDINRNTVKVNFSEAVTGTMNVKVSQMISGTMYEIPVSSVVFSDSSAIITLASVPNNKSQLYIDVISYDIKDLNGNSISNLPSSRLQMYVNY